MITCALATAALAKGFYHILIEFFLNLKAFYQQLS